MRAASPAGESTERLLATIERVAQVGIVVFRRGVLWWSEGAAELLGLGAVQTTPEPERLARVLDGVHPLDRESVGDFFQMLMAGLSPPSFEFRTASASKAPRWLQARGTQEHDEAGATQGAALTLADVTEARAHLSATQELGWAMEETQRVASLGTSVMNLERQQVTWSSELRRQLGVSGQEPLTLELAESFVYPDDRAALEAWASGIFAGRSPTPIRTRVVRTDQVVRTFELNGVIRVSPVDGTRAFVGTTRDITDQNALEEKLRHTSVLEALGTLASGVAHDVNNSLTVISGSLTLLEKRVSPGAFDFVREAARAVDQCTALTRQLLAFARRHPSAPQTVDANAVLSGFTRMVRRVLRPDISLAVETLPAPALISVDPAQLESALINLAINARDAMPKGGKLTLRVQTLDPIARRPEEAPRGAACRIDVIDTGVGISAEHLPTLFQPYFGPKAVGKGSGLGLASVLGTMLQNHGAVTVESTVGEGTCFALWLPLVNAPAPAVPIAPSAPSLRGRILVVDDLDLVRKSTARILRSVGYEVVEAGGGRSALEVLESGARIDVVLSDLVMPDVDGRLLAQMARERGFNVPFVFVTGRADVGVDHEELASGDRVLLKPFAADRLFAILEELTTSSTS